MVPRVRTRFTGGRSMLDRVAILPAAIAAFGLLAAFAGCGSSLRGGAGAEARADIDRATPGSCAATVLEALGHVAMRVYREGVASERAASALHLIAGSSALRSAVEKGSA